LSALANALQSGDLESAQKAFAALQPKHHHHHSGRAQSSGGDSSGSSTINSDFNALATALQSGDIAGAQQAFATLVQDAQAAAANFFNSSQTNGNIVNLTA
jgi:hypothetical protein